MAKLRKEPYVMLASSTEFVSSNGGKGYWKIKVAIDCDGLFV